MPQNPFATPDYVIPLGGIAKDYGPQPQPPGGLAATLGTPESRGIVLKGTNPFGGISKDYGPAATGPTAPPAMPPSAPSFGGPPQAPVNFRGVMPTQQGNPLAMIAPILMAFAAGGKDLGAVGQGLAAYMQGQRMRERQRTDQRLQAQKEAAEQAEFYSRALQNAQQFDDPVLFEQWKQAIAPLAKLHGIPVESFTFSNQRQALKAKADAATLLDTLDKKHPDGNYSADWKDPKTGAVRRVTRAELASIAGQGAYDAGGQSIGPSKLPTPRQAPMMGSFEDYVARKYGENPTPEQIVEARKVYQQADDRPRVTVNTGAAEARTNARVDRIVTSFNSHPLVKEFNEVQAQHGIIRHVVNGTWSGPGDMAAVFAFMKALDPTSVVRETEYDNAAKSGNIFSGWAARFNGALNPNGGFLSEQVRRDFLRTIESRLAIKTKQYQNLRQQLVSRVDRIRAGAPETGDEALIDYGSAMEDEPTTGTDGDVNSALAELERRRKARTPQ